MKRGIVMIKRATVVLVLLAGLLACAQHQKQTDGTNNTVEPTSGLKEIGILAKGME
jgi:hypothetical protein